MVVYLFYLHTLNNNYYNWSKLHDCTKFRMYAALSLSYIFVIGMAVAVCMLYAVIQMISNAAGGS